MSIFGGTAGVTKDENVIPMAKDLYGIPAGMRLMTDSAFPLGSYPMNPDIILIYIGGDTVHPWTDWEIAHDMPSRYRVPCWVRSNPGQVNVFLDAALCVQWMHNHHVPQGTSVVLDLETAVDTNYVNTFNLALRSAGWKVTKYGSQSTIWDNPKTDGGTFLALPGAAVLTGEGDQVARQYAFDGAYDLSVCVDQAHWPVWDMKPPPPPPPPPKPGPKVVFMNGTETMFDLCNAYSTTPDEIIWQTCMHHPKGLGTLERQYFSLGDWRAAAVLGCALWVP